MTWVYGEIEIAAWVNKKSHGVKYGESCNTDLHCLVRRLRNGDGKVLSQLLGTHDVRVSESGKGRRASLKSTSFNLQTPFLPSLVLHS